MKYGTKQTWSVTELIDNPQDDKENKDDEEHFDVESQASTSEPRRTRIHSSSTYAESEISLHDSSNDGTMNDILEMMEKESNLEDITESSKPKKFKTTH